MSITNSYSSSLSSNAYSKYYLNTSIFQRFYSRQKTCFLNRFPIKLSRYRDLQLHVGEHYS